MDSHILLNYPSGDNIIAKVIQLGPGSLIYKVDISRPNMQLKVDPGDLDLLGLKLKNCRPIDPIWVQTWIFFL